MARARKGLFQRFTDVIGKTVSFFGKPLDDQRDRPVPQKESTPPRPSEPVVSTARPATKPGAQSKLPSGKTLADRVYHVPLAGRGLTWFRPTVDTESLVRDYVFSMQGYVRGGTRNQSVYEYASQITDGGFDEIQFEGVIEGRTRNTYVDDAQMESSLDVLDDMANRGEPLGGDGWKSE